MAARHVMRTAGLEVAVNAAGAELASLKAPKAGELLWQADPAWWGRHAPILFPIVGRLEDDAVRHRGGTWRIGQHGFARDRAFAWVARADDACTLRLSDDEGTRAHFPFAFDLRVDYRLAGGRLDVAFTVANPGAEDLPFGIGAHPGLRWPLADGLARERHVLLFERAEAPRVRKVKGALLDPEPQPSPLAGARLDLRDDLFANDAIILDPLASRSVRYAVPDAPGAPSVEVGWDGFPHLGIWTRPGAPFLCIEPWQSYVAPAGLAGDFAAKPGLAILPPGGRRTWRHWFVVTDAA